MRLALLFPEAEKGGRGKKSAAGKALETSGFSRQRLDQARAVPRHSRELAEAVRPLQRYFESSSDRAGREIGRVGSL
jgi:hypothetical protein